MICDRKSAAQQAPTARPANPNTQIQHERWPGLKGSNVYSWNTLTGFVDLRLCLAFQFPSSSAVLFWWAIYRSPEICLRIVYMCLLQSIVGLISFLVARENSGGKRKKTSWKNTMLWALGIGLYVSIFLFPFIFFCLVTECLLKLLAQGNILFK